MRGRRTCIVLGAGASHAYEEGQDRLPLQRGFFHYIRHYCMTPPVRDLMALATSRNFNAFAERYLGGSLDDPWAEISNNKPGPNNDLGLEEAYKRILESDMEESDKKLVVASLHSILYTAIAAIVVEHSNPDRICRHHRRLAQIVEPGDVIISFNYDCLVDDAMMYACPYWYPLTGYGVPIDAINGELPSDKAERQPSSVSLLHPHGSILFRTDWTVAAERGGLPAILLLGPQAGLQTLSTPTAALVRGADGVYDVVAAINAPSPVSWDRSTSVKQEHRCDHVTGSPSDQRPEILLLEPLIVFPTPTKEQVYLHKVGTIARETLIGVEQFCFVGYSLPPADAHVPAMFPVEAMRAGNVIVVNAARNEDWLLKHYITAFPGVNIEFVAGLFQEWVASL